MPFNTTNFKVETSDGRNFRLLESVMYCTEVNGVLERIDIPVGTETDGASIPRIIWNVLPPFGIYWRATVLHDYLYRYTKRSRLECDNILLEAMINLGVDEVTRNVIYDGVRVGGEPAFNKDRENQAK